MSRRDLLRGDAFTVAVFVVLAAVCLVTVGGWLWVLWNYVARWVFPALPPLPLLVFVAGALVAYVGFRLDARGRGA